MGFLLLMGLVEIQNPSSGLKTTITKKISTKHRYEIRVLPVKICISVLNLQIQNRPKLPIQVFFYYYFDFIFKITFY